jgi:hypothetical protein
MLHQVASIHACPGLPDPRLAFLLQHAPVNVCAFFTYLTCPYPSCSSPSNLIQNGPALEKLLQLYCPCSIPHLARQIFAQSMSIEPCPVRRAIRARALVETCVHIISARPSKQPLMVHTFLKVYMDLGSYFLFLQEQIKDIIICRVQWRFSLLMTRHLSSCHPVVVGAGDVVLGVVSAGLESVGESPRPDPPQETC